VDVDVDVDLESDCDSHSDPAFRGGGCPTTRLTLHHTMPMPYLPVSRGLRSRLFAALLTI